MYMYTWPFQHQIFTKCYFSFPLMVEAAGVEPASGNLQQWRLHAYPELWHSPLKPPPGGMLLRLSCESLLIMKQESRISYPASRVQTRFAGKTRKDDGL